MMGPWVADGGRAANPSWIAFVLPAGGQNAGDGAWGWTRG
jgi:hypothetical protein